MKTNKITNKIITVERTVNIYLKAENDPVKEISVDSIPIEKLKKIVHNPIEDQNLFDSYVLNESQLRLINYYLKEKIIVDTLLYDYFLVTGGIYDWNKKT